MCGVYAYVYNSTLPPTSPSHRLTTSKQRPKGPPSNAVKQTSRHPRQLRLSVSNADNIIPMVDDQDSDFASFSAFAVWSSQLIPDRGLRDLQHWLLVVSYTPARQLVYRHTFA
jgi:hypothetical protein